MSKQESIEQEGIVTEVLPNAMFRIKFKNKHEIIAYTSGKIKKNNIKIVAGDEVSVEMSPYDLTKGRVVYRRK